MSMMLLLSNSCGCDELSLSLYCLIKADHATGNFHTVQYIEINTHFVSEVKKERAYY